MNVNAKTSQNQHHGQKRTGLRQRSFPRGWTLNILSKRRWWCGISICGPAEGRFLISSPGGGCGGPYVWTLGSPVNSSPLLLSRKVHSIQQLPEFTKGPPYFSFLMIPRTSTPKLDSPQTLFYLFYQSIDHSRPSQSVGTSVLFKSDY